MGRYSAWSFTLGRFSCWFTSSCILVKDYLKWSRLSAFVMPFFSIYVQRCVVSRYTARYGQYVAVRQGIGMVWYISMLPCTMSRYTRYGSALRKRLRVINESRAQKRKVCNFDLYRPVRVVHIGPSGFADTWTARYRAVPPKIDRWRSISAVGDRLREKSTANGRLREKLIVDGRLSEKKGRRRRRGK
ncbi:hypothetical protein BHE74_00036937 [Ensete ventricosum]|nr:hypothetical protein BHE74_00036937 [Ensete ventricosum]